MSDWEDDASWEAPGGRGRGRGGNRGTGAGAGDWPEAEIGAGRGRGQRGLRGGGGRHQQGFNDNYGYRGRGHHQPYGGGRGNFESHDDYYGMDNRRRGGERRAPSNGWASENRRGRGFGFGEPRFESRENVDRPREAPYVPETELQADALFDGGISSGINFEKHQNVPTKVTGDCPPKAIASFEESGLRNLLLKNIKNCRYTKPTPVQKHAVPIVMEKRDMMACAQTGSGKTAAFLLPIINTLLAEGIENHAGETPAVPEVLVIAPTRELAIQIKDESRKFSTGTVLQSVVLYGGTSVGYQADTLKRGVNILIATPGRLLDFVDRNYVSFRNIKYLVLDEADRMLDMGFMPDVTKMVRNPDMPDKGDRQTLMFSATFPERIQQLAAEFLNNYLFLAVGVVGGACADVKQDFFEVTQFNKREKLIEILQDLPAVDKKKMLIFVEKKKNADFLASYLSSSEHGYPTTSIHGDRFQRERELALNDFKNGSKPILVATQVAARGLDIKNVAYVVNYDLPQTIDEYVHRIGRTGRMGNEGRAISFYDKGADGGLAKDLVKVLKDAGQEPEDWLQKQADSNFAHVSGLSSSGGFGGRDIRNKRGGYDGGKEELPSGGFGSKFQQDEAEEEESWD